MIQTDAALNPFGNSGAARWSTRRRRSHRHQHRRHPAGARAVLCHSEQHRPVRRAAPDPRWQDHAAASIGVAGQNVPLHRRVVRFFNLPVETGVLVTGMEPESPATSAGLEEGDVILSFAGKPIADIDTLHRQLTEQAIGREVEMIVLRHNHQKQSLKITPAATRSRGWYRCRTMFATTRQTESRQLALSGTTRSISEGE